MKARMACLITALLLTGIVLIVPAAAQSAPYIVYGDVTKDGSAVAGASVSISIDGSEKATGTTDSNGHYQISVPNVEDNDRVVVTVISGSDTGIGEGTAQVSDTDPASLEIDVTVTTRVNGGGGAAGETPQVPQTPATTSPEGSEEPETVAFGITEIIIVAVIVGGLATVVAVAGGRRR